MHVTLVDVRVRPEHVEEFILETRKNHEGSRTEPGNLRFDVLRSEEDGTRFLLIEVYRSAAAATAHKQTPHYAAWRDAVSPWMAAPREGRRWTVVAPEDPARW